jgi:NTP pyrophosphatase (non-canonical NTP hydrolase)
MPIYEFFCQNNRRIYSFFARSMRFADKVPRCPDNPKWKMDKMISGFAITGRAKEPSAGPAGGDDFDDAKMEAAMGEMEREFGGLADSDNPDPRALARMMRRVGELSGQKLPAEMDEVIARLEKGEDPDKLESEFGDVFNAMDEAGGGEEGGGDAITRTKARRKKRITRDPKLYEMSNFCD